MKTKWTKLALTKILFIFSITFMCILSVQHRASAKEVNGFDFKFGDIMVTSTTTAKGLTGHAGIVLPDGGSVLHIAGYGCTAKKISINDWFNLYPQTKVVRSNEFLNGLGASYYGKNYFLEGDGKNIEYGLLTSIRSKKKMYCSKLVWQCYEAAGLEFKTMNMSPSGDRMTFSVPIHILPYDFLNQYDLNHNGFKLVKSFNW